jgi:hypothetical protein
MTGQAVGVTALHQYKPKDLVAVALLNNDRQKCIILGRYNVVVDVFASKNIVTALTNAISALTARVEALEAGD